MQLAPAVHTISLSLKRLPLVGILGWQDIRGRYRRSKIGPFWLTISMGVMIGSIGLVFGQIFRSPMADYLPFLAAGLIFWAFISGVINEGCMGFIDAEGIIKQLPIPLFVHILRVLWRNTLIFGHNILIFPLVLLAVGKPVTAHILLVIPGFLLAALMLSWVALFCAIICARYRDLPNIVASILQVAFYLTPIIWSPSLLPERAAAMILQFNPFYHLLELLRAPLLGAWPEPLSWLVVAAIALFGWVLTLGFFARYQHRVAYWL